MRLGIDGRGKVGTLYSLESGVVRLQRGLLRFLREETTECRFMHVWVHSFSEMCVRRTRSVTSW